MILVAAIAVLGFIAAVALFIARLFRVSREGRELVEELWRKRQAKVENLDAIWQLPARQPRVPR